MNGKFYVYEHWRTDKNECFYVGKGTGNRAYKMKDRNIFHKAIQQKLSNLGLAIEIKIIFGGLSEQEAFDIEIARIVFWRADGADLANLTDGGEGVSGIIVSKETKEKLRCAHIGKNKSLEHAKNISKGKKGKSPNRPNYIVSEETKKKISNSLKGNKNGEGHSVSNAAKQALSSRSLGNNWGKFNKGKLRPDAKERLIGNKYGKMNEGRKHSEEAKIRMSIAQKKWREKKKLEMCVNG